MSRPASLSRTATVWVGLAAFCLGSALWLFPALPAVPAGAGGAAAVHYPWTAGFGLGLTLLGVALLLLARWLPRAAGR